MSQPQPEQQQQQQQTMTPELLQTARCAFCLNFNPQNPTPVTGDVPGTAYLCDDCNNAKYYPKFIHTIQTINGVDTVATVDIPQPQPT